MEGTVQWYSIEKGLGWIKGEDNCIYFAHQSEIEPNYLHLRFLDKNELVEFVPSVEINKRNRRNENKAISIKPQNRPEESIPSDFWEIGTISYVSTDGTGWIKRSLPHESIFFSTRDVTTFGPIEPGIKVVFGLQHDNLGRTKAANIEICLPDRPDFDISQYMIYQA